MADQDFRINIRTIADTTGIQLTRQQLTALQTAAVQGNQKAITALNQLKAATKEAASASGLGFSGSAVGIGTMLTVMGATIRRVQEFNAEQDKILEQMEKVRVKSYEFGLSVVQTMDDLKELERIDAEPLAQSFDRLTQKTRTLKAEMKLAFDTGAYEDFKKLNQQLQFTEGLLNRVSAATERNQAAQRAAGRASADFARDASAARAADPQAGMTAVEKNAARLKQIEQLAKRKDLTQAEQIALRDAYIQTEKGYFDAEKEDAGRAAELMRQRQQGPGPGTLRTLDYFTKGPGAPTNMQTQGDKLDAILNYMKTVWGY